MNVEAHRKISRARARLIATEQPLYGLFVIKLDFIEAASIKTIGTDGYTVLYAPSYVNGLSDDMLIALIKHQIGHILCMAEARMTKSAAVMAGNKYTFRDLKVALEMDPADTRGLPKVK